MEFQTWWASDILVLGILTISAVYILSSTSILRDIATSLRGSSPDQDNGPFSLRQASLSYHNYYQLSMSEASRMRAVSSSLTRAHRRIVNQLGYPRKLDQLEETIRINSTVTEGIAREAHRRFPVALQQREATRSGDVGRVRESLKHFIRDWSEEGKRERDGMFKHILDVLKLVPFEERGGKTVLVPGAGLGRLAWEISELGFDTTANELSYFMILSLHFLLSPSSTIRPNQHTLHPYAYWFSHQKSNTSLFRAVQFPDTVPRLSPTFKLSEADFLSLKPPQPPSQQEIFWTSEESSYLGGYDYIVTLFFIDTSLNVISTIEHIHHLLRPGGTWINLGPLLWTAGAQAKVELSLDEVLNVVREVGFTLEEFSDGGCSRTVECEYTADRQAMMQWIYKAEFWIARKGK